MMSNKRQTIVIGEDYTILREGLRSLISSNPDFEVVAEAGDGQEAINFVEKLKPDLILMDLSMPRKSGMDAIREIRKRVPETKIVVLTIHKTEEYILEALKAGADGYVLKDATHAELIMAAKNVLSGKRYLSPGISDIVIKDFVIGWSSEESSSSAYSILTARERQVLQLMAEGKNTNQIADSLFVSVKTVEAHRKQMMNKLDIHSVAELTKYAIRQGLTSLEI